MRRWTGRSLLSAALVLAAISSGCGKNGTSGGGSGGGGAQVTVSPQSSVVTLNSTQQFTAGVSGSGTVQIAATNGAVRTSNVVTITTSTAHNLAVGQVVIISGVSDSTFLGTFLVASVPTATTFTYAQTAADASSGGGTVANISVNWFVNDVQGGNATFGTITATGLYTAPDSLPSPTTATITSTGAARASNVVTITTSAAHNFVVGQLVVISGVTDTSFNGSFLISTVPSTTTFTFSQTGSNVTSGGGTVTSHAVKIKAVSVAVATASGTALVGLSSGVTVRVTPSPAVVGTNETLPFIATVSGSSNTAVTWAVNNIANGNTTVGQICAPVPAPPTCTPPAATDTTVEYRAPAAVPSPASVTLDATSVADTTRKASAAVSLVVAAAPTLTAISPATAPQGVVFQDVFLTGTNFLSTSLVRVNSTLLPPGAISQFSTTLIRVRLPVSLLASPGTKVFDVQSQNGTLSAPLHLAVVAVRPALVGAAPDSALQGGGNLDFNVNGGYFGASTNPAITAEFGSNPPSTPSTPVSAANEGRQATVKLKAADLNIAGLFSVAIKNNATNPALFAATNLAVRPSGTPAVLGSAITVGSQPSSIAINEATGIAVVTNRCSNTVSRIDVNAPATVFPAIAVGTYPTGVAVDAMQNLAVVTNGSDNTGCPPGPAGTPSLSIVDLTAGSVTATITTNIGAAPFSVAVNPLTGLALVAYQNSNHADILDLTLVPPAIVSTTTITTGASPKVAMEPRLNWAVVTPGGTGTISIVDLAQRSTAAISTSSRSSGSTTITTAASHPFQLNQVVLISGMADASFNGVFTITSVPSSTTFTYLQTGAPNASSSGGMAVATPFLATASIGPSVRGIAINTFTQQAILADPGANGPALFNLFDQAVTNVSLSELGASAAAFNPFTNIAVTTNFTTNEASVIDPETPTRVAKLTVGNGPRAVAIDPGTNIALVVNETSGNVTAIDLGAIRPLHITSMSMPLSRQVAPGITLTSAVALPLTIFGKGLLGSSQVRLDGVPLAGVPINVSDRQLTVSVPATSLAAPHNYVVDVLNSGGTTSNVLELTVIQAVDMVGAGGASCTVPAPAAVAIDADRNLAIVTNPGCDNVSFIDLATATITSSVTVQSKPRGLAVNSRLGTLVVTNSASSSASILNLTTLPPSVTSTVTVGSEPLGVAIDERTGSAVVTNASSNSLSIFDATLGGTPQSVAVDARPVAVAIDPDRQYAAVAHAASNGLALVNLTSLSVIARITNVSLPTAVVFDPVTGIFIANLSLGNGLVLLNPNTFQAVGVRAGINPTSIAYNFNSSTLVTTNTASNSISVMDFIQRRIRSVMRISASSQFAVAIHPVTNLAVVSDAANNRVLLIPLPR